MARMARVDWLLSLHCCIPATWTYEVPDHVLKCSTHAQMLYLVFEHTCLPSDRARLKPVIHTGEVVTDGFR